MASRSNPHTARQLAPAIGATVTVRCEQLHIRCLVKDAKNAYGQVRILVMPVAGEGEQWVELSRLIGPEVTLVSA